MTTQQQEVTNVMLEFQSEGTWYDLSNSLLSFAFKRGGFQPKKIGGMLNPTVGTITLLADDTLLVPNFLTDLSGLRTRITRFNDRVFTGWLGGFEWETQSNGQVLIRAQLMGSLLRMGEFYEGLFTTLNSLEIRSSTAIRAILDAMNWPTDTSSYPELPRIIQDGEHRLWGPAIQTTVTTKESTLSLIHI